MTEYFLHHKCSYTFDADGTIAALTSNEERRLWNGLRLWHEEIENQDEDAGSTAAQERKKATAADKRRFNELVEESDSAPAA